MAFPRRRIARRQKATVSKGEFTSDGMSTYSHPFLRADAAPRLTGHLRALSLIAPIQRSEDTKGMLHLAEKATERVDLRYLSLAAIELLIDRMGTGNTATR